MAVSSSSMDDQEDRVSPKCEEAWFDDIVADPCGKEFELPDISTPMFSPNKLLDTTPAALENAFVLDMNNLYSFAGNQYFSSPQITNSTVPMVNHQQGTFCSSRNSSVSFVPIVNQQVHFPPPTNYNLLDFELAALKNQLVHVPISSGFSLNGLDMNFPLRTRRFHADNSTHPIDKSKFGSNIHIPSKTSEFSSNNCIVHLPVMTNILANRKSESDTEKGQHHHRKRTAKTVSFGMRNQVESPTPAPQMRNYQQAFGASFHVARNNYNVKYVCKECNKEFPSYSAFGGHMSFHARTRKKSI